jgi:hypothetical protein
MLPGKVFDNPFLTHQMRLGVALDLPLCDIRCQVRKNSLITHSALLNNCTRELIRIETVFSL